MLISLIFHLLFSSTPIAQAASSRVALVIGVGAYQHAPVLANTLNDARAVAAQLTNLGYDVDLVIDPDREHFESALRRLGERSRGADAAIFYYAGHGLELSGHNWLVPVEANIQTERALPLDAVDLDTVMAQMEGQSRVSLVILDACRENPFRALLQPGRGGAGGGLGTQQATVGTLIAYSTQPGAIAADDGGGQHSAFTASLLSNMMTSGMEIRKVMAQIRHDVRLATQGRQIPWEASALEGDFYLSKAPAAAPATRDLHDTDAKLWDLMKDSHDAGDFRFYLYHFPSGRYAPVARGRILELQAVAETVNDRNLDSQRHRQIQILADHGDGVAQASVGSAFYGDKNFPSALQYLKPAVEQGNAIAQFFLGAMYIQGTGVARDFTEGLRLLHLAADQGNPQAQLAIGVTYIDGINGAPNKQEALKWYRLAATQGSPYAQSYVAEAYETGQGVQQDYAEALRWYSLATAQADVKGEFGMGRMYDRGDGVKADSAEAFKWYKLAAIQGNTEAQMAIGSMYEQGRVVEKNDERAYMWFTVASRSKNNLAITSRDRIGATLPPEQKKAAQSLAEVCVKVKFSNCW